MACTQFPTDVYVTAIKEGVVDGRSGCSVAEVLGSFERAYVQYLRGGSGVGNSSLGGLSCGTCGVSVGVQWDCVVCANCGGDGSVVCKNLFLGEGCSRGEGQSDKGNVGSVDKRVSGHICGSKGSVRSSNEGFIDDNTGDVSRNGRSGESLVKKGDIFDVSGNSCHEGDDQKFDECGDKPSSVGNSRKGGVPGAFGNGPCEKGDQFVGANVDRNRAWRKIKKEKKQRKKNRKLFEGKENWRNEGSSFSLDGLVRDQDIELRNSLAAKWKAENALAKMRAERQLAVLSASDLQDEVRQHRTKLSATIERNMVSIEKTHATLRATGNVAGVFHGSAETVLTPDLSSGTISPDSSASMQEFRAAQKKILDLESKIRIATEKLGIDIEHIDLYDKDVWTNNSTNEAILDEMYPNGYGMDGTFCDEGKVRVIPT